MAASLYTLTYLIKLLLITRHFTTIYDFFLLMLLSSLNFYWLKLAKTQKLDKASITCLQNANAHCAAVFDSTYAISNSETLYELYYYYASALIGRRH